VRWVGARLTSNDGGLHWPDRSRMPLVIALFVVVIVSLARFGY
jgi:hypothetical protein